MKQKTTFPSVIKITTPARKVGALLLSALLLGQTLLPASPQPSSAETKALSGSRPNIILIITECVLCFFMTFIYFNIFINCAFFSR